MEESSKLTSLSDLGEFGLIHKLTENFTIRKSTTLKGIGDDAAVLNAGTDVLVVTTDLLVENVHFNLGYTPLKHLGYKSVVVNVSDVAAMNAVPEQITVSLAVSNRFSVEALQELYAGIKAACDTYGVDLIGGDTTSSTSGLLISVTAIGRAQAADLVYRNTAQPNDLICVTGDLGGAYAGLQLLERENSIFKANPEIQPKLEGYEYILQKQLRPEARTDMKKLFEQLGVKPTSMIDISDGLSSEIIHIGRQSELGCKIFEDKIPIADETIAFAKEVNIDPTIFAMNGGEDYELLFTIASADFDKIRNHPDITVIGHMLSAQDQYYLVARDGTHVPINAQGWNALLSSPNLN